MKKLFHDYSARGSELLNIFWACGEIASMSRHVADITKIGERVPRVARKSPCRLCESHANEIRELKIIPVPIFDFVRDSFPFKRFDDGNLDDLTHHYSSRIVPL